jgi:hypothetical protein
MPERLARTRSGTDGMYRRTVRGETRVQSFTGSSEAIRCLPHMRFAAVISAINCRLRPARVLVRAAVISNPGTARSFFDAIERG